MLLSKSLIQSWIVMMRMLASEFLLQKNNMNSMDIPDVAPNLAEMTTLLHKNMMRRVMDIPDVALNLAERLRMTTLLHKNLMRRVLMANLAPNLRAVTPRMRTSPHRKQLWMTSAMPACRACHMRRSVRYCMSTEKTSWLN